MQSLIYFNEMVMNSLSSLPLPSVNVLSKLFGEGGSYPLCLHVFRLKSVIHCSLHIISVVIK